jgi:hypothetical protein
VISEEYKVMIESAKWLISKGWKLQLLKTKSSGNKQG